MKFDPTRDVPDLDGKVALVTGSTSGIGFAVAQILVRRGAKVYFAARNEQKAKACLKRIEDEGHDKGQALWHLLDLDDPLSAKRSAEEFLSKEERLDILINNAAVIIADFKMGTHGIQEIMIVNHFSPFVFTDTLLPLLKKTAAFPDSDVRIINMSSGAHTLVSTEQFKSKDDFNLNYSGTFASMKRYALTKLCNVLWTKELQKRLTQDGADIICIAVDPGSVFTESAHVTAQRFPSFLRSTLLFLGRLAMKPVLQGAGTPCIAATTPDARKYPAKYGGAYMEPMGKVVKTSNTAQNEELAAQLWDTTEAMLKEMGA